MSRYEYVRQRRAYEKQLKDDVKRSIETLDKIKKHFDTQVLGRESYPDAWAYVEAKFPGIARQIHATKVYKNENTAFCSKIGIPKEAGGLFFIKTAAILICWARNFKDDVVIVHEMLHYCSQLMGSRFRSRLLEEDFAYVKSIRYLLLKGYDREFICEKYMLPHYFSYEMSKVSQPGKPLSASAKEKCRKAAMEKINALYDQEMAEDLPLEIDPEPPEDDDLDRFDFI